MRPYPSEHPYSSHQERFKVFPDTRRLDSIPPLHDSSGEVTICRVIDRAQFKCWRREQVMTYRPRTAHESVSQLRGTYEQVVQRRHKVSFLAFYPPACLPACPPARLPACPPARPPACICIKSCVPYKGCILFSPAFRYLSLCHTTAPQLSHSDLPTSCHTQHPTRYSTSTSAVYLLKQLWFDYQMDYSCVCMCRSVFLA